MTARKKFSVTRSFRFRVSYHSVHFFRRAKLNKNMEQQLKDLHFLVFLVNSRNKDQSIQIIPANWCRSINIARAFNDSLNRNANHVIFYSPIETKEADFLLPLQEACDLTVDGCHQAKILKSFCKFSILNFLL